MKTKWYRVILFFSLLFNIVLLLVLILLYLNYPQTETVSEPVAEFVNWETYRNEYLGFEIKYPPNYQVLELGDEVQILREAECQGFNKIPGILEDTYTVTELGFVFRRYKGRTFTKLSKKAHPDIWLQGVREDDGKIVIDGKIGYFFYRGGDLYREKSFLVQISNMEAFEIDSSVLSQSPEKWSCQPKITPFRWDMYEKILSTLRFF